jgi:hypothetical protein
MSKTIHGVSIKHTLITLPVSFPNHRKHLSLITERKPDVPITDYKLGLQLASLNSNHRSGRV